ncbi:hypothetical protein S7711_07506 [Stachybotrys chartarum IBT 7711]|uniref:Fungal N-terminal domain-containing protein n=1 Tax=Stachybotrys chartarum (strain CBS 109288 / IBT 7711) TaxID=1280523 RepID=A0A084B7F3_STACB|nr:hypothetical protein S7711_07506 [Stachybotrys chartarum IBT 7711]KFA50013.1 hypothetical protein S40293_05957 [Stachybotrys chartarum IBT 40293]
MADPLSIAASVAGLLTLAGGIYSFLSDVIDSIETAPQAFQRFLSEVSLTQMTLASMSDIITAFLDIPMSRRAMLQLDHLVLAVTSAVLTLSDLELFLSQWPALSRSSISPLTRMRWSRQENKAAKLLERLRETRVALSLVLNVLQCVTDFDAMRTREQLQATLDQLLQENGDLRKVLADFSSGIQDNKTLRQRKSTQSFASEPSTSRSVMTYLVPRRSFDSVLDRTWVYSRVRNYPSDVSLSTNQARSQLGSLFSKITTDRISSLSVVALPVVWTGPINPRLSRLQSILEVNSSLSSDTSTITSTKSIINQHKIVLVGEGSSGKTSLAVQFCCNQFYSTTYTTIEDQYHRSMVIDNERCELRIIDTASMMDYEYLRELKIKEADAFIITYSVCSIGTFLRVQNLHRSIQTQIKGYPAPIVLVGTAIDAEVRTVTRWMGQDLAEKLGCGFFECSAKDSRNVEAPFQHVVRLLRDQPKVSIKGQIDSSQEIGGLPVMSTNPTNF